METKPTPSVPQLITMNQVRAYVQMRHGITISRMTPYNWARKGIAGDKLWSREMRGKLFTTKGYVDAFLASIPR